MQTLSDPLRTARMAVRSGRFRDAAAALAELPPEARAAPEWYLLSAMAAWRLGDFEFSRRLALEARAGFRTAGDADGEMRSENVAAAGAFGLGDLAAAEQGFSQAMELARQIGDDLMLARCSNNLGNISLYLARHDAAQAFYRFARAEFERLAFDHGIAETWINTAIAWRDLGQFGDAAAASDRALEAAERARSLRLVGEALSSRGEALAALGEVAVGRAQVERGLALARAEGDRLAEPDALRILANMARVEQRYAEAERLAREGLAAATQLGHPWTVAEIRRDLGELYVALGRREDAAECFRAAEAAFQQLGSMPRADAMRARADRTEAP
jgi:tetratricopeptide (TPR) repeat protein